MPRQPRYFIPGVPQHVVQRGVDRQAVFFEYDDYQRYLQTLQDATAQYGCNVHAYVLMTNHVHLLATPLSERALPQIMQALGRSYVQKINAKYDRTGPLWQGRYKASIVQSERYLLLVYRYIEMNPVRARMVARPADYFYSSYAANALGRNDGLVTAHPVYLALGKNLKTRRERYRRFFEDSLSNEELTNIRDTTNACRVLGSDQFKDQIERMLGRSVRPGKSGRPRIVG
ncbi:MAG: transposase [Pseudomonadota bacterium]